MSHETLIRCLKTLSLLQSGLGYNAMELAREFGVSQRTVYRDLGVLKDAGIPITFCTDRNGYILDPVFRFRSLPLTGEEWVAVVLACCAVVRTQASFAPLARQASAKLLARLPPDLLREASEGLRLLPFSSGAPLSAG